MIQNLLHVQQYVVGYIIENIAVRVQSNKDVVHQVHEIQNKE